MPRRVNDFQEHQVTNYRSISSKTIKNAKSLFTKYYTPTNNLNTNEKLIWYHKNNNKVHTTHMLKTI